MYCATIPTGSLPPPSITVELEASGVASVVASSEEPSDACAVAVASGAAVSLLVEPFPDTTIIASKTTAMTTAITTRFDDASFDELLTDAGTLAPGVFAGRLTTEGLWKLDRVVVEGTAGTTKVEEAFFAVFFALFLTAFLTTFLAALFFAALFFAVFFAEVFLAAFLTTFFADFLAEVFLAVFLTATVVLLGLRLKSRFKTQ